MQKRFLRDALTGAALLSAIIGLAVFPSESVNAAREGALLCLQVIIPSLFPFFVLSSLIIKTGFGNTLGKILSPVVRPLLGLDGSSASAFVLGLIGGYPVGAQMTVSLFESGLCQKREAERMLAFCNNCGPAFILGVVGSGIFGSGRIGLTILLSHIIGAFCVGYIFRTPYNGKKAADPKPEYPGFAASFADAVRASFASTLGLCGFIIFFSVLIKLLSLSGLTALLSAVPWADKIFTGLIEISSGVWQFKDAAVSDTTLSAVLISFILGFGGISVYCQVLSVIGKSGLSSKLYLIGKLLHGMISAAVTFLFMTVFNLGAAVNAGAISAFTPADQLRVWRITSALSVTVLILLGFSLLLYGKRAGKKRKKAL